jgi:hypothetical protein
MSTSILEFLSLNIWSIPFLLICLVGGILALVTWRKHPLASLLSLLAFGLFSLDSLLSAGFLWYMLRRIEDGDLADVDRARVRMIFFGFLSVVNIFGWVLLLIALFARRPMPRDRALYTPEPLGNVQPTLNDPGDDRIRSPR